MTKQPWMTCWPVDPSVGTVRVPESDPAPSSVQEAMGVPSQVSRHGCGCRVWNSPEAPTLMTSPRRSSFGCSPEVMMSGGLGGGAGRWRPRPGRWPAKARRTAARSRGRRGLGQAYPSRDADPWCGYSADDGAGQRVTVKVAVRYLVTVPTSDSHGDRVLAGRELGGRVWVGRAVGRGPCEVEGCRGLCLERRLRPSRVIDIEANVLGAGALHVDVDGALDGSTLESDSGGPRARGAHQQAQT